MTVDFAKFPFPSIENPKAATLTEAIRAEPLADGFVVIAIKVADAGGFANNVRAFARALRAGAERTGFTDISAFRTIRPDGLGGAVPFDQSICESIMRDAARWQATEPEKFPGTAVVIRAIRNDTADWVLLVEFRSPDQAVTAATGWSGGDEDRNALTRGAETATIGAFVNKMRYGSVSRDPNLIQFFNFFSGPGDLDVLWPGWLEALPWFLEKGEFRSSFALAAIDPSQSTLLINFAHMDSLKHWLHGVCYDPGNMETVLRCNVGHGFSLPMPFFCKTVPV